MFLPDFWLVHYIPCMRRYRRSKLFNNRTYYYQRHVRRRSAFQNARFILLCNSSREVSKSDNSIQTDAIVIIMLTKLRFGWMEIVIRVILCWQFEFQWPRLHCWIRNCQVLPSLAVGSSCNTRYGCNSSSINRVRHGGS